MLGRWNRVNCGEPALATTLERLGGYDLKERGDESNLKIHWQAGDGESTPAFLVTKAPLYFRRVAGEWKLDANVYMGESKAANLFGPTSIWSVCRDELAVMAELTSLLEKGTIKDLARFELELKRRVEGLKAKYEK